MHTTNPPFNGSLHPSDVSSDIFEAVDRTRLRLGGGLDPMKLLAEIQTEVTHLASSRDTPDAGFAKRACSLLGVALAEGVGAADDNTEAEVYYEDLLDDFHATVASTVSLLSELGSETLTTSMRRLLAQAAAASLDPLYADDYVSDLFLASAYAVGLAATDS